MKDIYCLFICVFHLLVQLPIKLKERKEERMKKTDKTGLWVKSPKLRRKCLLSMSLAGDSEKPGHDPISAA